MKKIAAILGIVLMMVSCTESEPPIDFGRSGILLWFHGAEQLSLSDLPEKQYRGILIEDLTAVKCVGCPGAAEAAKQIKSAEENNEVVVLGLYTQAPPSLTNPHKGDPDMRTEAAQLIGTNIFDFGNNLPGGGVNRKVFDGESEINIPFTTWASNANEFKDEKSIVNLEIQKSVKNDSTMIFKCFVTFLEEPMETPFLSLFLLENEITAAQSYLDRIEEGYVHSHVVRENITPYNGMPLKVSDGPEITIGSKIEVEYHVQIPADMDWSKSSIAALVNYNAADNKEVIHCTEVKLQ